MQRLLFLHRTVQVQINGITFCIHMMEPPTDCMLMEQKLLIARPPHMPELQMLCISGLGTKRTIFGLASSTKSGCTTARCLQTKSSACITWDGKNPKLTHFIDT